LTDSVERVTASADIESFGRDLVGLAKKGALGPIYEREGLILALADLLSIGSSVLLVGESGVGKNAIVEGLACWVAKDKVTSALWRRMIVECNMHDFLNQCFYVGNLENKILALAESAREKKAILFIDNIHLISRAGASSEDPYGTVAANILPFVSRGEFLIIGATTPEGLKILNNADPVLVNQFIRVDVPALSEIETQDILSLLQSRLEIKYNLKIDSEMFKDLIYAADRYMPGQCFPGKAFRLLKDVAGTKITEMRDTGMDGLPRDATLRSSDIWNSIERSSGLCAKLIQPAEILAAEDILTSLKNEVFGQDAALEALVNAVIAYKAHLNDPTRPIGSFIFAGPSGVGKTETAKALAGFLFGSFNKLLRFDMSEYSSADSIEKAIGVPGLRNSRALFVEQVMATPHSVILLDEIEKAHERMFDILLQVLDEGRLTDHLGRTAYFLNSIIIMTSNLGSSLYGRGALGFQGDKSEVTMPSRKGIRKIFEDKFRPEFLNRLTDVVHFAPLTMEVARLIIDRELQEIEARKGLSSNGITISLMPETLEKILDEGLDPKYGARPVKRAVNRYVTYPLARSIASGEAIRNRKVVI
jgi:ATP-dependent Clp protease ATP-binding subunit ClpC